MSFKFFADEVAFREQTDRQAREQRRAGKDAA